VTHLRCARCGSVLTRNCRWGAPEDHDPEATDRAPAVAPGVVVRLRETDARPLVQNGDAVGAETFSPAGAISANPSDLLPGRLRPFGPDSGCCGSAGLDGPNRACAVCGAVVATERSDCWTQAEIRFAPGAVVAG